MGGIYDEGPFNDKEYPTLPNAALTSDQSSPRRYQRLENDDFEDCERNAFLGFPESRDGLPYRVSPNIFTRSARSTNSAIKNDLLNAPDLKYGHETPRAKFTSRESPKRQRHTGLFMGDAEKDSTYLTNSNEVNGSPTRSPFGDSIKSTSRSEKILELPQPIFSPETFAEANSYKDDDQETLGDEKSKLSYDYDSYQKAHEWETRSLSSSSTAYTGGPTSVTQPSNEQDYFGASIDRDMMVNIENGYVPNREKPENKRKVRLIGSKSGNFVLENPIPEELKRVLAITESPFGEFTHMSYTACTSEPDEFVKEGYTLRAAKYGRETEIVICVTMYNEDEYSFARTMHGVMKNISYLCSRHKSSTWGKNSWKKVQVIIMADGRNKVNSSILQLLTATGCYQDNLARPYVNNKRVNTHLFEYTTQISIDENLKFKGDEKNLTPVQVLFCLKESNQKKINSHKWLFNAFCPVLDPNVVVLLDVGTKPHNHAVYNLWKAFDRDSNVAGAAGEVKVMKGKGWKNLVNPLVASQNFEYKMSNILDKPLESLLGYITVLPGALSAYRYIALKNHEDGTGPLASYFKGEALLNTSQPHKNNKKNFFDANMYLAEDRILCWELVSKRNESWVLKYVKQASGETDVPEAISEFLPQRRRWINGATFAALYSLYHFKSIWRTAHTSSRKFLLHVEALYQLFIVTFSYFSLANFYLTFYFLTGSLTSKEMGAGDAGFWIFTIFNYLCICCLTSLFIVSIGNHPQASKQLFKLLMILLTVCALYALIVGLVFVAKTIQAFSSGDTSTYVFVSLIVSLLSTYGLYTTMSLLYLDPWHMITCSIQYFLMIPSYTCTLQIFAFCNTHDVSWGTKGQNDDTEDKKNQYVIEKNDNGEFEAVILDVNIDEVYLDALYNIRAKRSGKKVLSGTPKVSNLEGEDYAKDVRTRVVLLWLLANLIFIMAMVQVYKPGATSQNIYLAVILWSVAVFALLRSIGSVGYLIQQSARFFVETKSKWSHGRKGYMASSGHSLN